MVVQIIDHRLAHLPRNLGSTRTIEVGNWMATVNTVECRKV
jgi:hypothetical protein